MTYKQKYSMISDSTLFLILVFGILVLVFGITTGTTVSFSRLGPKSIIITQIERDKMICIESLRPNDVSNALIQVMDQGYIIDHCEAVPDYYRSSIILFVYTRPPEEIKLSIPGH